MSICSASVHRFRHAPPRASRSCEAHSQAANSPLRALCWSASGGNNAPLPTGGNLSRGATSMTMFTLYRVVHL